MIIESKGSMFGKGHEALVCPVNMVGAMGKGLALYFRDTVPGLRNFHRKCCQENRFSKFESVVFPTPSVKVILFPSKIHWENPSKLDWINKALMKFKELCEREGIMDVGMPAVGCGNGELAFEDVRFLIYHHFENSAIRIHLYSPY